MRLLVTAFLSFLIAAGPLRPAAAATLCGHPPRPVIEVHTLPAGTVFDTSKSAHELESLEIDTASPWPENRPTAIGGITQGKISASHRIEFSRATNRATHAGCTWISKIEVFLRIEPKIYIASDLRGKACQFGAVFSHEASHAAEDLALSEKFRSRIADGLAMAFATPDDYLSGNLPLAALDAAQKEMGEDTARVIAVMFEMMTRERAQRQQEIDSLREYIRINAHC